MFSTEEIEHKEPDEIDTTSWNPRRKPRKGNIFIVLFNYLCKGGRIARPELTKIITENIPVGKRSSLIETEEQRELRRIALMRRPRKSTTSIL